MGPPTRHTVLISDVKLFVTSALNSLIFKCYKHTSGLCQLHEFFRADIFSPTQFIGWIT